MTVSARAYDRVILLHERPLIQLNRGYGMEYEPR